jgi:hypothetical protein
MMMTVSDLAFAVEHEIVDIHSPMPMHSPLWVTTRRAAIRTRT